MSINLKKSISKDHLRNLLMFIWLLDIFNVVCPGGGLDFFDSTFNLSPSFWLVVILMGWL